MCDDFGSKVVLVTGAGSGIGREAAGIFASRGAVVYCADIHDAGLFETKAMIAEAGDKLEIAHLEVSAEDEVSAFLTRIDNEAGRLDAAFNNAEITGGAHRIEDCPADDFDKVLRGNLRSVFLGMKYEFPLMKRSGGGAICNTTSVAALTGPGGMWRLRSFQAGWPDPGGAMENAAHNIRVNPLAPGWTETPMVMANSAQYPAFAIKARAAIPAKRGGHPCELAAAAVWLCSEAATYVFGDMLVVDGGMTIGGFEAACPATCRARC